MMVEVFKTDVRDAENATMLVRHIHQEFREWKANFDLEDCDNILRVASQESIDAGTLIALLHAHGFAAELLPD